MVFMAITPGDDSAIACADMTASTAALALADNRLKVEQGEGTQVALNCFSCGSTANICVLVLTPFEGSGISSRVIG